MIRRLLLCASAALLLLDNQTQLLAQAERPNILWITSEDHGPDLGCYGVDYATTPTLDAFAERSLRYRHAWSNAPVCAPARTTLISGVYATTLGASAMRCSVPLPEGWKLFPQLLREAGYWCSNRSKTDYNLSDLGKIWDQSSAKAHWRNRPEGAPFFSVINFTLTHESKIRARPYEPTHDPALAPLPAYFPDHPEVRLDMAQYHDRLTELDARVGQVLADLEADGLADDTIVFFFSDHGSGLPRGKRAPYDSGFRVPLILHVPERWKSRAPDDYQAGGWSERLVGFVDLGPTVLGLAGVPVPETMQGKPIAGAQAGPAPEFLFGFRDRMDERTDLVRTVTDGRWVYLRNYHTHRVHGQHVEYQFRTPTTRIWNRLHSEGQLVPEQSAFWEARAPEELYDLEADPAETEDRIGSASIAAQAAADRLRAALDRNLTETGDLGFVPEPLLRAAAEAGSPFDLQRSERWPLSEIRAVAEQVSEGAFLDDLDAWLAHEDPAVATWAALGFLMQGQRAVLARRDALREALGHDVLTVRIHAAEALARFGDDEERDAALDELLGLADLRDHAWPISMQALEALDAIEADWLLNSALGAEGAATIADRLRALPKRTDDVPQRVANYVHRLLDDLLAELEAEDLPPAVTREEHVYRTVGERQLRLHLWRPRPRIVQGGPETRARAAVVWFHGGGWRSGSYLQFEDQSRHLAQRGLISISAEYRLGQRDGATPFDCVDDARAAFRWVHDHAAELGIDPLHLAAGGGSAGGHLAAAMAFCAPEDGEAPPMPAALVLFNPVVDNSPTGFSHPSFGERWKSLSPLHNVPVNPPPTLVYLGTEDTLIPVETGQRFIDRIEQQGGHGQLMLYPDQPHGFFNRDRNLAAARQTMRELDQFLLDLGWLED